MVMSFLGVNRNVNTTESYSMVNCEVVSSSSFRDFSKRMFCDGEVGDRSGGVNTICSRPELADEVISSEDTETFQE